MVDRSELMQHRRILFTGPSNSGKTWACVNLTKYYVNILKKSVLYIGINERSADIELDKVLNDVELAMITYINYNNSKGREHPDMMDRLNNAVNGTYGLVVIDPIHHITPFCRNFVRNQFLEQGWYILNKKVKKITNPSTFELEGFEYGKANSAEARFKDIISCGEFNCVFTMTESIIESTNKDPTIWHALADVVVELRRRDSKGMRHMRIAKNRKEDLVYNVEELQQNMNMYEYLASKGIYKLHNRETTRGT